MQKKNIFIIILIIIIILLIGAIFYLKNEQKIKETNKENKAEINETKNVIQEKEQTTSKKIELDKKKKVLEDYLSIYALHDSIQIQLYEKLNLRDGFNNYEEYYEKEFVAYESVTKINGEIYNYYKTNIKYEDFKEAMLNYISEELFEQDFTLYQKENNGMLEIYANGRDGSNYAITNMTEISNETYEVEYKFYMGENEGIPGKITVVFEKNNNDYIVKKCIRQTLENIRYLEVSIEDTELGQAMYKEPVKIENQDVMKELEKIINSGIEHNFNGAFGLDMPPVANFYLENGDKVIISAVDNLEMQGEEKGNYIFVTINDDFDNKKAYKVQEKIGEYFTNLYDERLLTD